MKYKTIDHIVITTENLEACLHFYVDILGMRAEEKNGRYALFFGNQKFNIHTRKAEFLPAAGNPEYGSLDLCLAIEGSIEDARKGNQGKRRLPSKKALSHAMGRGVK